MPPEQPGGLPEATYLAIVAYILQSNGAVAGGQALTPQATSTIRSVAMQQAPPAAPAAAPAQAAGGRAGGAGGGEAAAAGRRRRRSVGSRSPATSRTTRRSPTRCCATPRRRLADDAPRTSRSSYSPLNQITRDNVDGAAARVGVADERGRRESADAARAQRHHLSRTTRGGIVQALDGRTGELIWEQRARRRTRCACAACRDLRGQAVRRDERRAPRGARRPHRQERRGTRAIARRYAAVRAGRSSSRARSSRAWAAASATSRRSASSAPTTPRPASSCGGSTPWPRHGEPGRRLPGASCRHVPRRRRDLDHRQLRSRSEHHLLGHRAGQAVDAGQPRHVGARQGALHELDAGARSPTPASSRGISSTRPARRSTSTKCSSACSWMSDGQKLRVHHRQGRHPVEARSQDRQVPRPQGDGLPERLGHDRSARPASRTIAATSSTPRSASGSTAARAPRAATTGRR